MQRTQAKRPAGRRGRAAPVRKDDSLLHWIVEFGFEVGSGAAGSRGTVMAELESGDRVVVMEREGGDGLGNVVVVPAQRRLVRVRPQAEEALPALRMRWKLSELQGKSDRDTAALVTRLAAGLQEQGAEIGEQFARVFGPVEHKGGKGNDGGRKTDEEEEQEEDEEDEEEDDDNSSSGSSDSSQSTDEESESDEEEEDSDSRDDSSESHDSNTSGVDSDNDDADPVKERENDKTQGDTDTEVEGARRKERRKRRKQQRHERRKSREQDSVFHSLLRKKHEQITVKIHFLGNDDRKVRLLETARLLDPPAPDAMDQGPARSNYGFEWFAALLRDEDPHLVGKDAAQNQTFLRGVSFTDVDGDTISVTTAQDWLSALQYQLRLFLAIQASPTALPTVRFSVTPPSLQRLPSNGTGRDATSNTSSMSSTTGIGIGMGSATDTSTSANTPTGASTQVQPPPADGDGQWTPLLNHSGGNRRNGPHAQGQQPQPHYHQPLPKVGLQPGLEDTDGFGAGMMAMTWAASRRGPQSPMDGANVHSSNGALPAMMHRGGRPRRRSRGNGAALAAGADRGPDNDNATPPMLMPRPSTGASMDSIEESKPEAETKEERISPHGHRHSHIHGTEEHGGEGQAHFNFQHSGSQQLLEEDSSSTGSLGSEHNEDVGGMHRPVPTAAAVAATQTQTEDASNYAGTTTDDMRNNDADRDDDDEDGDDDVDVDTLIWQRGELIGRGSFGKVFAAQDLRTGKRLAVKQVSLTSHSRRQKQQHENRIRALQQEISLLLRLHHKHVIRFYGTQLVKGRVYVFLEYATQGSVLQALQTFGAFSEAIVRSYTRQTLLGLEYLHANHIIHRDVKPSNLLLDRGVIKLADFGCSTLVKMHDDVSEKDHKTVAGTCIYWAPEIIQAEEDGSLGYGRKVDIFSAGLTSVHMSSGQPPFPNAASAVYRICITKDYPGFPTGFSPEAHAFLAAALVEDPAARADATELLSMPFCHKLNQAAAARHAARAATAVGVTRGPKTPGVRAATAAAGLMRPSGVQKAPSPSLSSVAQVQRTVAGTDPNIDAEVDADEAEAKARSEAQQQRRQQLRVRKQQQLEELHVVGTDSEAEDPTARQQREVRFLPPASPLLTSSASGHRPDVPMTQQQQQQQQQQHSMHTPFANSAVGSNPRSQSEQQAYRLPPAAATAAALAMPTSSMGSPLPAAQSPNAQQRHVARIGGAHMVYDPTSLSGAAEMSPHSRHHTPQALVLTDRALYGRSVSAEELKLPAGAFVESCLDGHEDAPDVRRHMPVYDAAPPGAMMDGSFSAMGSHNGVPVAGRSLRTDPVAEESHEESSTSQSGSKSSSSAGGRATAAAAAAARAAGSARARRQVSSGSASSAASSSSSAAQEVADEVEDGDDEGAAAADTGRRGGKGSPSARQRRTHRRTGHSSSQDSGSSARIYGTVGHEDDDDDSGSDAAMEAEAVLDGVADTHNTSDFGSGMHTASTGGHVDSLLDHYLPKGHGASSHQSSSEDVDAPYDDDDFEEDEDEDEDEDEGRDKVEQEEKYVDNVEAAVVVR